MFPLQVLDNILSILINNEDEKFFFKYISIELYANTLIKNTLTDLIIEKSLQKLISENYVVEINTTVFSDILNKNYSEKTYKITWEGHFFFLTGGYLGRHNSLILEKERVINLENEQLANANKINELQKGVLLVTKVLAWLTGVASLYYIIEIAKFANSFFLFWDVKK